jgi:hypothetical protein
MRSCSSRIGSVAMSECPGSLQLVTTQGR